MPNENKEWTTLKIVAMIIGAIFLISGLSELGLFGVKTVTIQKECPTITNNEKECAPVTCPPSTCPQIASEERVSEIPTDKYDNIIIRGLNFHEHEYGDGLHYQIYGEIYNNGTEIVGDDIAWISATVYKEGTIIDEGSKFVPYTKPQEASSFLIILEQHAPYEYDSYNVKIQRN
ncbi:MAG: hypothetical protein PHO02_05355 [Candidatus Nanoarchaeia archaeon]|nr:hypothetical protein [Candidatus Nanoarchaeia archaeon]